MSFYPRMRSTAQRLISKYNQGTANYNHPSGKATPFTPGVTYTSYLVNLVQAPTGKKEYYEKGGHIQAADTLVAVAPFAIRPTIDGTLTLNDEEYQIVMVDSPTALPTGQKIVYFLGLRK